MNKIIVCPSILSANFINLEHEINLLKKAGINAIHIDVMDGHFVKNISFGVPIVESLRGCGLLLDVHLMVTNPLNFIDNFAKAGASLLTFHVECFDDIKQCILAAKQAGCGVGLAIKPSTNVTVIEKFLTDLDLVVIMTVEPGFGGQVFIPAMMDKVRKVRSLSATVDISVDGGINIETAQKAKEAGANWLVSGSAIFKSDDYANVIIKLKE